MTLQLLEKLKGHLRFSALCRLVVRDIFLYIELGWTHKPIIPPFTLIPSPQAAILFHFTLSSFLNHSITFPFSNHFHISQSHFPYSFDDISGTFIWWPQLNTVLDPSKGGRAGPLVPPHLRSINVCADWKEGGKFLSCKLAALLGSLPPKLKACVESRAKALTVRIEGNGGKTKGNKMILESVDDQKNVYTKIGVKSRWEWAEHDFL